MKRLVLLIAFALPVLAQVTLTTAIEPAFDTPARFGVSAAVVSNFTANNAVSMRVGSGRTYMPGYVRTLTSPLWSDYSFSFDVQGGKSGNKHIILYGVGLNYSLGDGASCTFGVHVNKLTNMPVYVSGYVSINYEISKRRL